MSKLADFDLPFSDVEQTVMDWVQEAFELRHGEAGDPKGRLKGSPQETYSEVMDLLTRVRTRSDRVEELLTRSTLAKGRAARAQDESKFAADLALMNATRERSARRVEFSSGREREAEAKLDAIEDLMVAHQSARMVSITNDAYTTINQIHWQLSEMRKDLRASLHALQFESGLER